MITPANKDAVLNWLCQNLQPESLYTIKPSDITKDINLNFEDLYSILNYFQRKGFVQELNARSVAIHLILCVEANDFLLRGGFVGQEEILENNIKKLLLEIDHLKKQLGPDQLDTLNKLSSIASAVYGGLSLIKT